MNNHPIEKLQPGKRSLAGDTRGLSTVEYIILLALVAIVGIAAWTKFGDKVQEKVGQGKNTINEKVKMESN